MLVLILNFITSVVMLLHSLMGSLFLASLCFPYFCTRLILSCLLHPFFCFIDEFAYWSLFFSVVNWFFFLLFLHSIFGQDLSLWLFLLLWRQNRILSHSPQWSWELTIANEILPFQQYKVAIIGYSFFLLFFSSPSIAWNSFLCSHLEIFS